MLRRRAAQKFDRSPAQRVRSKEEMQRNGRDLPLAAGRGIWSLHRRSGEAGQSRGVVCVPRRSHLPAVRAVSGIYEGVPNTAKNSPRVYLKTDNAPGQRAFSRCAASFFLEIRQYSCEKMSCSARKFLAAGHITSFQIHPRALRNEKSPPFQGKQRGSNEKHEVNTEKW